MTFTDYALLAWAGLLLAFAVWTAIDLSRWIAYRWRLWRKRTEDRQAMERWQQRQQSGWPADGSGEPR